MARNEIEIISYFVKDSFVFVYLYNTINQTKELKS